MRLKTMIVAGLVAASLGALSMEAADAQLFARLRARMQLRGGPGILDGQGIFDGGGTFDRFDQSFTPVVDPSNGYASGGFTNPIYGNSTPGYLSPPVATYPANTIPNQYASGIVVSADNLQTNNSSVIKANAVVAQPAIDTNQNSLNQSGTGFFEAPIANSQNANHAGAQALATYQTAANQQPDSTKASKMPGDNTARNVQSDETHRMSAADEALAMSQFFAGKLVLCNNDAIHAASYAAEKASHPEVKSFAVMLVKGHQKLNQQLAKFVPAYAEKPVVGENDWSVASIEKSAETKTSALNAGDTDSTFSRLYDVCRKASGFKQEQCTKMMSGYSAEELNMAFVGSQIVGHQMLLAELKAIETSSSGEFQSLIREAKQGVESHLETAMKLTETLSRPEE